MTTAGAGAPCLIVLSAPSGAGKTTLCHRLLREFGQLRLSISSTTRPPRGGEQNGREYFFLTRDDFEKQVRQGRFAEYAEVHGNLYGTSRTTLDSFLDAGFSVLLDIDVQGAASLRKAYPGRTLTLFVEPPSLAELERRLRARGTDSEAVIQQRLANAKAEMARHDEFDHVIVNDTLERAYEEIHALVEARIGEPDPLAMKGGNA